MRHREEMIVQTYHGHIGLYPDAGRHKGRKKNTYCNLSIKGKQRADVVASTGTYKTQRTQGRPKHLAGSQKK